MPRNLAERQQLMQQFAKQRAEVADGKSDSGRETPAGSGRHAHSALRPKSAQGSHEWDYWPESAWGSHGWGNDGWSANVSWADSSDWTASRHEGHTKAIPSQQRPEDELSQMADKAGQIYANLPRTGRKIWNVLQTCIKNTLSAGVVHFERELRSELEIELGECDLIRQAGSQWVLSIGGETCHVSIRSEVLGSGSHGSDLLNVLKRTARTVKSVLLDDGAFWLRELTRGDATRKDILQEVQMRQEHGEEGKGKSEGFGKSFDVDGGADRSCHICSKSFGQDLLGG